MTSSGFSGSGSGVVAVVAAEVVEAEVAAVVAALEYSDDGSSSAQPVRSTAPAQITHIPIFFMSTPPA